MLIEFVEVQFSPVAFVLAETIFGKAPAKFPHQCVARHFRDHARGRDAQAKAIAIDERNLRKRKRKDRKTIYQHVLRRGCETGNRADDLRVVRQVMVDFFAQLGRKLLGIVQLPVSKTLR